MPSTAGVCPYLRWLVWHTTQKSVSTRAPLPWNASALWQALHDSIATMSRCGAVEFQVRFSGAARFTAGATVVPSAVLLPVPRAAPAIWITTRVDRLGS